MKKILFLDIDGVLVTNSWLEIVNKQIKDSGFPIRFSPEYGIIGFCPKSVNNLLNIIRVTGCEIVLTSTWRLKKDTIEQFLSINDISEGLNKIKLVGITPTLWEYPVLERRGHEIDHWIKNNIKTQLFKYAIVDDEYTFLEHHKKNVFLTSIDHGLENNMSHLIIEHFNDNPQANS